MVKRKIITQDIKNITQNTVDNENRLKSNECLGVLNLCKNEKGEIIKRPGFNTVLETSHYSGDGWISTENKVIGLYSRKIGSDNFVFYAHNRNLYYKKNTDATEDISGEILTNTKHGERMKWIDLADITNQSDNLYVILPRDGANSEALLPRKWLGKVNSGYGTYEYLVRTLAFPSGDDLKPTCTASGSGVLTGTFYYIVTAVMNTGTEIQASSEASASPSSQKVTISIANTNNGYIKYYKVYRSKAGTSGTYYYLTTLTATVPGGSAVTYDDNTTDAVIETMLQYDSTDKDYITYKATTGVYAFNRLWLTGDPTYHNSVIYSDAGKTDSIRASNLYINNDFTNNPITDMCFHKGVLYFFQKYGGIWVVRETGNSLNPFIFNKIATDIGCSNYNTVAKDDNYMYFGYKGKAYKYSGSNISEINAELNKIPEMGSADYFSTHFFVDFIQGGFLVKTRRGEFETWSSYETDKQYIVTGDMISTLKYANNTTTDKVTDIKNTYEFIEDGYFCRESNRFYITTFNNVIAYTTYGEYNFDTYYNGETSAPVYFNAGVEKKFNFNAQVNVNSLIFYGDKEGYNEIDTNINNSIYLAVDGGAYGDVLTCYSSLEGYELPINRLCRTLKVKIFKQPTPSDFGQFMDYMELKVSGLNGSYMHHTTSGGID